jgi:pSer/pThr/pTyr-binding forkhead associated (FHA) protein
MPPAPEAPTQDDLEPIEDDEAGLEKTLVVDAHPTLRALSGPGAGKNFPLSPSGTTSIGRSRRNDILVPEDAASAQHCRIDREGDSYVLHDLGATNGTWVNGTRSDRAVLQHGDRLKVGETVFTVSLFGDRS